MSKPIWRAACKTVRPGETSTGFPSMVISKALT
jgi:hypothetical protein